MEDVIKPHLQDKNVSLSLLPPPSSLPLIKNNKLFNRVKVDTLVNHARIKRYLSLYPFPRIPLLDNNNIPSGHVK